MSANFTPTLHEYTDLTPFRFWCQKILPLAYDDSLSYYELLCKVVDYLNKTMEDVTLSIEDVQNLHAAYVALQGYVNNYFNNLDVQEEINNKLDALVADGTIHTIFTPDVMAILNVAQQASLEAIAAIPSEVTSWLNQHIAQETGYVIDDTLTVSGAAADAKVTGDKIGELKSDITRSKIFTENTLNPFRTHTNKAIYITGGNLVSGGFNGSTVKVFAVTSGEKYNISRNGAQVSYGFANSDTGNNTLTDGAFEQNGPISVIAPNGYAYLFVQDISSSEPDAVCSVELISATIDVLTAELDSVESKIYPLYTDVDDLPEKTHTNKGIYTSGGNIVSGGVNGAVVKVFPVTPGVKYKITKNNGLVSYGFANTNFGNNILADGALNQNSPVSVIAPEGYIYLYVEDITSSVPDGVCSVQHESTKIDVLTEDVTPLVNNIYSVLNRVRGKYICHLGVNKNNNIIIPCQSLSDIMRAKRLGFNAIEINVRQTSDGKYVCLHGSSGAFGQQFTDLNGDSVSDVQVSSMTLQQIKDTIKYKSNYARYRTAPYTLQEVLFECRKLDMLPLVEWQSSYTDEIEIIDSIMGKNNYLIGSYTYDRSDIGSDAPMYSFLTTSNADDIIAKCKKSGGAYVACLNVTNAIFNNFTIDDWRTLVSAIHSAGYMVASAYGSEQLNQILLNSGFDVINSTGRNINEIESPNVYNLTDNVSYDGYTTGGTISSGVLTLTNGDTITPSETAQSVFLGGGSMHIRFSGTINLSMGAISEEITSDGASESWFTSYYEEQVPTFTITAVGNVTVYSLLFKASKM